jgi:uncharacterized membrane protein
MSYAPRLVAPLAAALAVATTLAPTAMSDPNTDSASDVIAQLKEQGYAVEVKGVPSGDTGLLASCIVTSIRNSGVPTPDPTTTTTVYLEVACPIHHS